MVAAEAVSEASAGGRGWAGGGVRGGVEEVVVCAVVLEVVVLEDLDVLGVGDRDPRQVLQAEGGMVRGRQTELRAEELRAELRARACFPEQTAR